MTLSSSLLLLGILLAVVAVVGFGSLIRLKTGVPTTTTVKNSSLNKDRYSKLTLDAGYEMSADTYRWGKCLMYFPKGTEVWVARPCHGCYKCDPRSVDDAMHCDGTGWHSINGDGWG